jgi:hypothetical protein
MLKIYINNEEVVANNDFTINKHMLNTPSVILNNVCPKEWKENKDYSSFYHPQDYSKCKIQDETYIPAEPGTYTTINGTATIQNVSASKLQEVLQLDGDTTQETTTGKNLYKCDKKYSWTSSADTWYFINGVSGAYGSNIGTKTELKAPIENGKTYTISFDLSGTTNATQIVYGDEANIVRIGTDTGHISRTFTSTQNGYAILRVKVGQGNQVSFSNIMLEESPNETTYEPYTNGASPNPTYPQPINVVSGRQTFTTVGKNLFDKDNVISGKRLAQNGTLTDVSANINFTSAFIKVEPNTNYIRNTTIASAYTRVCFYSSNNESSFISYVDTIGFLTPSNCQYIRFCEYLSNLDTTMLEKGSTATEYEAYTGQSYEINLGKNLLNLNSLTKTEINGITYTPVFEDNKLQYININGTATATSVYQPITFTTTTNNILNGCFGGSSSTYKMDFWVSGTTYVNYNNENTQLPNNSLGTFRVVVYSGKTVNNVKLYPMISKGGGEYSPYKTPIELCKTRTAQDHIFKAINGDSVYDNLSQETKDTLTYGSWYKDGKVGKVVLNGTQTIYGINTDATNTTRISYDNIVDGTPNDINIFCNRFTGKIIWNIDEEGIYVHNKVIAFRVNKTTGGTTVSTINNFLANNNVVLYYKLATPTYTEITDSELIEQLNSIELIEGLNNVSISSPYLTAPIYIHYNFVNAETLVDLLFCGVVKNSGKISLNPREPHLTTLQILDFKDFLSSGELDGFVIYQKTILEAIQMVIGNIQDYGFVLGNVNILNPNEVIGAYSTKDKTAYDVFNYLADITQSRWTTRLIDENTVAIDFYDPTLMVEGTAIDYTQSYFENNLIDNMSYNYGSNNYRNKQVMTSNQVYSNISQAQTMVANGYQTQFPTEQPIGKINSITANNIPMTFSTFNEKDMGYVADFYYNPGDNYIESDDLRSTGEIIVIDYVAIVEGRQIITNPLEIDRIKDSTGRKGIVSRYETRNDATTSTELQKIGESYIKYKGTPEIVLTIDSRKNLWEVGQRVQFNAPIDELETEYMVRTKKINYIVSIDTLFYTYELVSSFNSETEINYFDNQRAKSKGNIGEGEYISRNIDIESSANIIFYDTDMTEVQITGDNTLNSILNSPFED